MTYRKTKLIVPAGVGFNSFVIVAITIAALYLTREILVPMALAVLLSFVLAPLVRTLQRWRLSALWGGRPRGSLRAGSDCCAGDDGDGSGQSTGNRSAALPDDPRRKNSPCS